MNDEILVRPAEVSDWPDVKQVEDRWRQEGVAPISRQTFDLWMATHPQGFLVAMGAAGDLLAHAYCENMSFQPELIGQPGWDKLLTRPYQETHHDTHGNATLILNAVTVPGSRGGLAVVQRIIELARSWGKEWLVTIPRMPGLAAYYATCAGTMESKLDEKIIAAYYAVSSMLAVGAGVYPPLVEQVRGHDFPEPKEPDQVVARFAGKKLGVTLYGIIPSGYPDPPSMNLAALCLKKLN